MEPSILPRRQLLADHGSWQHDIVADPSHLNHPTWPSRLLLSPIRNCTVVHEYAYRIYRHTYNKIISECIIAAFGCCLDQLWTCVSSTQHHHRIKKGGVKRGCGSPIFQKCKSLLIPSDRFPRSVVQQRCLPDQFLLWQPLADWARWWLLSIRDGSSLLMCRGPKRYGCAPQPAFIGQSCKKSSNVKQHGPITNLRVIIFLTPLSSSPEEPDHGFSLGDNAALSICWNRCLSSQNLLLEMERSLGKKLHSVTRSTLLVKTLATLFGYFLCTKRKETLLKVTFTPTTFFLPCPLSPRLTISSPLISSASCDYSCHAVIFH